MTVVRETGVAGRRFDKRPPLGQPGGTSSDTAFTAEAALEQASASLDAGRTEIAEKLCRDILKNEPQNAHARKRLHQLLKDQKKQSGNTL